MVNRVNTTHEQINDTKVQRERNLLNNRACRLAYEKKFAEALIIFDELLETDPDDFRALSNRATVIGITGRYDEAATLFEHLVAIAPNWLSNRICYINLLTFLGKYEPALACYKRMPRPAAMTYMLLGSLSEDFKTLQNFHAKTRSRKKAAEEMALYRKNRVGGKPTDSSPRFIGLLWAPEEGALP